MREQQKAQTRQLLIDAGLELFADQGYSRTTIEDITNSAGASRATFYLHFSAKWQIVYEMYERILMPETVDYYRRLNAFGVPDRRQLQGWLEDAIGFYERHRTLLLFGDEANAVEPELAAQTAHWLDDCTDAMPRYLQRWEGAEREQARLRLQLLIVQLSRFAVLWVHGHWKVDRATVLAVLLELWAQGLRIDDADISAAAATADDTAS